MIPAREALERLRAGNARFVSDPQPRGADQTREARAETLAGQHPFAIVLGCSDSRVPVELVFDQGVGDLFVIRVAGNVAGPSQVESIEFAASQLRSRLIVVLGHSRCGAVQATLGDLREPSGEGPSILRSIIDRIRPSVEPHFGTESGKDPERVVRNAVRANIRSSAKRLRTGSVALKRLIRDDGLLVVGAEYSLESGVVDFFDGASVNP